LQDNASDKFLEVVVPTDIDALLAELPHCRAIVTTGEKATEVVCSRYSIEQMPKVGEYVEIPHLLNSDGRSIILYRLPSSSRAYPLAFAKKVDAYRKMFLAVGVI
jgi:G:T/U-mismatch repair DNA glycosylase